MKKKKKTNKKIIIIAAICVALIIGVVAAVLLLRNDEDDTYKHFDENEQYHLEKDGAKEYSSPVLVMYGEDEQLVGVTQLGNKVYLDNPDNIPVEEGSVATKIEIKVDDDGVRRGNLCYPYSTNVNLAVYASQSKAPEEMANMRIQRLMNSPGYASITDYKINSVTEDEVISGEKGTAIIHFTVNCDVKPSKFADVYGEADGDGWCRDLEYNYSIWGTNGKWYLLGADPIIESAGSYSESSVRVVDQTELFATDDMVLGYACFESPEQSIATDEPLVEGEEGEDEDYEEIVTYYTQLFAIDTNGKIYTIEQGMQNLQYNFITEHNGKVYMQTTKWASASESSASYIVCCDLNTMRISRLVDRGVILGITEDTIYAYGSNTFNGVYRPQDIYAVDMATGTVKWVTEPVMIATEENPFIAQGVYDGYLHVMYASDKLVFKLAEDTGEWSFHYAG